MKAQAPAKTQTATHKHRRKAREETEKKTSDGVKEKTANTERAAVTHTLSLCVGHGGSLIPSASALASYFMPRLKNFYRT